MRSIFNDFRYPVRLIFFISLSLFALANCADPLLLIKISTHECPDTFFATLDAYERNVSSQTQCHFLVTCDKNDSTMNNGPIIKKLNSYSNVRYEFVDNKTPVELSNSGLTSEQFDLLLLAADDKEPCTYQFDKIIVEQYQKRFPTFDGILVCKGGIRTPDADGIFAIGRSYYDRFGFVFNPAYEEFCASQELISVAKILKKFELLPEILFCTKPLVKKNAHEQLKKRDHETFMIRRTRLFDFQEEDLRNAVSKDWSILICTMYERQASFNRLYTKLMNQIKALGLEDRVEILYYLDNRGEHSIGTKRNWLLSHSDGFYINFIDDDDDVSDDYIKVIYNALLQNPDSVSLKGLIAFSQQDIRLFIHSIQYTSWFEKNRIYYRPPNHLNTIKRYIGVQFSFPDISNGEDHDWSMQIADSKLIQTEVDIKTPYYFYLPSYCHGKIDFSVFRQ